MLFFNFLGPVCSTAHARALRNWLMALAAGSSSPPSLFWLSSCSSNRR